MEEENKNVEENKNIDVNKNQNEIKNESQAQKTQSESKIEKKSNSNVVLIVVIAILAVVIIAGAIGVFFMFNNLKGEIEEKIGNDTNVTTEETDSQDDKKDNSSNKEESKSAKDDISSEGAKASAKESPLKLGEWGLASKYVSENLSEQYKDTKYIDVPVRVTKVTRGDEATKIVKEWFDNQKLYKYEDPKAYTEWAVIDYQVDLSKLSFDEDTIGTARDVDSDVKGMNGGGIKYNDISYIVSTKDITDRDYVKEPGVYDCQFIVTLPQGCTDYLVKLGSSYNGSESYFKCE